MSQEGAIVCTCPLSAGACKIGLLFHESQGMPHEAIGAGWGQEGSVAEMETLGIWAILHVTYLALRTCLDPLTYIPLPFDDGMLLCMLMMARWVR